MRAKIENPQNMLFLFYNKLLNLTKIFDAISFFENSKTINWGVTIHNLLIKQFLEHLKFSRYSRQQHHVFDTMRSEDRKAILQTSLQLYQ